MATLSTPRPPTVRPPAVGFRLLSDARLAKLAAAGRDGAMAAIFERYHQPLHRYCYAIVGNEHDAADALQNTMVKALRSLPGETRSIALRPWLYRVAHNESISLLRARRSDSDLDAAAHLCDVAAAGAVESRERLRSLTEDLAELTERQRGAVLMRELGGMEFAEIADALQTTSPAVKQSVYEARRALQALQEGRAMDCDVVQRTISDGDRRALRAMRVRGHLRECACCRAFDASLRERPAQLGALIPPLPVAVAAGMIHSVLGGGGSGGGGGGLGVGLAGGAKATVGASLATKTAIALSVGATIAGGAAVAAPSLRPAAHDSATPGAPAVVGAKARRGAEPKATATRERTSRAAAAVAAKRRRAAPAADGQGASDTSSTGSQASSSNGASAGVPRATGTGAERSGGRKAAATSAAKPSRARKPRPAPRGRAAQSRRPAASSSKPSAASASGGRSRPGAGRPPLPAAANASNGASPAGAAPTQTPAAVPSSAGSPAATPPATPPGGGGPGKAAPAAGRP